MFEGITKKRKNRAFNYGGWALLIFVCGMFVFTSYSPDMSFGGTGTFVARVNGETITYSEFSRMYERVQEGREGQKLTSEQQEKLRKDVVNNLVNRTLIIQDAKKQGIVVSPKELADFLMQIPQFQENGKFSLLKYKQFLKSQGMTEARFEDKVAEDFLLQKMNNLYMRSAREDQFIKKQDDLVSQLKMNVQFIAKPYADVVTDKEITPAEVSEFIKTQGDKISSYYKEKKDTEFTQTAQVKAQHILIRVGPQTTEAQALEKIKKIASETNAANFTAKAKQYSEDPGSKTSGGELGFFSRGRMAPEFEDAAFNAKVGQVTAPVKTAFGYHLILVSQKVDAKVETLDEAKPTIARKLLKDQKMANAVKDIKLVLEQGPEATQKMLAQKGWTWEETGVFSVNDIMIPKLGENEQVLQAAVTLNEKNPIYKDVIEQKGNIFLVKYKPVGEGAKAAPNQMDMFKQLLERQKSEEMLQSWLTNLRKEASIKINPQIYSTN